MEKSLHNIVMNPMCDHSVHSIRESINESIHSIKEIVMSSRDPGIISVPTSEPTSEKTFDSIQYMEEHDNTSLLGSEEDDTSGSRSFSKIIYDWLYPRDVAPEAQLWRSDNIAVPLSYLIVGTFQGLSSGVMTIFLLRLNATEAQQTTILNLRALPATMKIFFGFISDTTPIFGYRRKGYMIIGWTLSSISMFTLSHIKNPSIPVLSLLYFLFGLGFWFADVIADSLMAEKARFETVEGRGQLQSVCYSCRFFALMVASIVATYAMERSDPNDVFLTMALLPWLVMMPAIWLMKETAGGPVASVQSQCQEIWFTICSRAIWQPMGFIYIFNILQIGNAAWTQYMYTTLKFTTMQINSFFIASTILVYLGILLYKQFFLKWSWRNIYIIAAIINVVLSMFQIMLLYGVNRRMGISDYWFAFGDDAVGDLVAGITFLPDTIMMAHLCPVGSEGASFAMFTTINNSAQLVSSAFSTLMLNIWDVSESALARRDLTGMVNLTILTTVIQTSGMLFIKLLPHHVEDLQKLNLSSNSSRMGGAIFLIVIIVSVLYSLLSGILNILVPGWAGGV